MNFAVSNGVILVKSFDCLKVTSIVGLDLQTGIVTGKAGSSMDWSVNTAYKTYKGTNNSFKFDWKN